MHGGCYSSLLLGDEAEAYSHSISSALKFGQWHKILSGAREKDDSDIDDGEGSATRDSEGKKKAVLRVEGFLWQRTQNMGNVMTRKLGCGDHHVNC